MLIKIKQIQGRAFNYNQRGGLVLVYYQNLAKTMSNIPFLEVIPINNLGIFVLAPMEDVTDAAFRQTLVKFGSIPHVFFTEFTNIDGLILGLPQVFHRLLPVPKIMGIPTIAQIWGQNIQGFKQAVPLILSMGYWGIDLNMGCPVKNVVKKGLGAALSSNWSLAEQIINTAYSGVIGFSNNKSLLRKWHTTLKQNIELTNNFISTSAYIPNTVKQNVQNYLETLYKNIKFVRPTLSVKTRVTVNKKGQLPDKWLEFLAKQPIDMLTIHFRTGPEQSKVPAHWELAKKIIEHIKTINPQLFVIGNGDIANVSHAQEVKDGYKIDTINGFMIGRGIFKAPLLFRSLWTQQVTSNNNYAIERTERTKLNEFLLNGRPQVLLGMFDYQIKTFCNMFKSINIVEYMHAFNIPVHENSAKKVLKRPLIKSQQSLKKFVKTYIKGMENSKQLRLAYFEKIDHSCID